MTALPPNPFSERGMIRDRRKFVGRARELKDIGRRLRTMQSVSIVGERRIGKSSFLYRISQIASEEFGADYQCQYLDLQRIFTPQSFYKRACQAIGENGGDSAEEFEEALNGKQVLLLLDEFEQVVDNQNFDLGFFDLLRSLAQTGNLALVTATRQPLHTLFELKDVRTSNFHNIFSYLPLGEFSRSEAEILIKRSAIEKNDSFSQEETDWLIGLAGMHPYRLTVACWLLFNDKLDGQTDLKQVGIRFREEMENIRPIPNASELPLPDAAAPPAEEKTRRNLGHSLLRLMAGSRTAIWMALILLVAGSLLGAVGMGSSNPVILTFAVISAIGAGVIVALDWVVTFVWWRRIK